MSFSLTNSGFIGSMGPNSRGEVQVTAFGSGNSMMINGRKVVLPAGNLRIVNGRIFVNGQEHKQVEENAEEGAEAKCIVLRNPTIVINIEGECKSAHVDVGTLTVTHSSSCSTASGDIMVLGNVNGPCSSMSGNVTVEGDCGGSCSSMSGNVRTGEKRKVYSNPPSQKPAHKRAKRANVKLIE